VVETVFSFDELAATVGRPRSSRTPGRRVCLALPALPAARRVGLERRLNRHLRACGCETGAVLALLALLAVTGEVGLSAHLPATAAEIVGRIAVILGAALAGKLVGLAASRLALRRLLREIASYETGA